MRSTSSSSSIGGIPFGQYISWSLSCVLIVTVLILVINLVVYQQSTTSGSFDDPALMTPKVFDYSNHSNGNIFGKSIPSDHNISHSIQTAPNLRQDNRNKDNGDGNQKKKNDGKSKSTKANPKVPTASEGNQHFDRVFFKTKCSIAPRGHTSDFTSSASSTHPYTTANYKQAINNNGFSFPIPKIVFGTAMDSPASSALHHIELASSYSVQISHDSASSSRKRIPRNEELSRLAMNRFCQRKSRQLSESSISSNTGDEPSTFLIKEIDVTISSTHDLSSHVNRYISRLHEKNISTISSYMRRIEAYILVVGMDGKVVIVANAAQGINYALNTLSEIVFAPSAHHLPLEIIDYAEKDWRGLMIDVSRHFQPIDLLKRSVDAMEASKFNVLHLHLTDAQSFPILLEDRIPQVINMTLLGSKGSFDERDKVYSLSQLKDLVQYAYERGIEVVPEIDVPAHALSWGGALSSLVIPCHVVAKRASTQLSSQQNVYPLDPSNPLTFLVVEEVLKQISEIFPSPYLHIGGDEVMSECYRESPQVMNWAKENYLQVYNITKYFEARVFSMVTKLGKIPIVWQGIMDEHNMPTELIEEAAPAKVQTVGIGKRYLAQSDTTSGQAQSKKGMNPQLYFIANSEKSLLYEDGGNIGASKTSKAIVEAWKCWSGLALRSNIQSHSAGHPSLMAACWYLDYNSEWTTFLGTDMASSLEDKQNKWEDELPPSNSGSDSSAQNISYPLLLGGEGAMWTENVDQHNFECRVWPRASAIAYRLWGFGQYFCHLNEQQQKNSNKDGRNMKPPIVPCAKYYFDAIQSDGTHHTTTTRTSLYNQVLPKVFDSANSGNSNSSTTEIRLESKIRVNNQISDYYELNVNSTQLLYSSYVIHRYYLTEELGLSASVLTFHYPDVKNTHSVAYRRKNQAGPMTNQYGALVRGVHHQTNNPLNFFPVEPTNLITSLSFVNELELGIVISTHEIRPYQTILGTSTTSSEDYVSSKAPASVQNTPTLFWITSQCFGITPTIQRPLLSDKVSLIQLNIEDGAFPVSSSSGNTVERSSSSSGPNSRGDNLLQWLQEKATDGVMLIGFCELSHWEHLANKQDVVKNIPYLVTRAATAGYVYSHMTPNSVLDRYDKNSNAITGPINAYPVGLLSVWPLTVIEEFGKPTFQRNILHVYIEAIDLHVFVIHFHAHSSEERSKEAQKLLDMSVASLLTSAKRVVIMGDFNTFSPHDQKQHQVDQIVEMVNKGIGNSVMDRWKKKYLDRTGQGIDYNPMELLLRAGMVDSCVASCCHKLSAAKSADHAYCPKKGEPYQQAKAWTIDGKDDFSQCMTKYCPYSEPTKHNPEWPASLGMPHPRIRVDFILISPAIVFAETSASSVTNGGRINKVDAGLEINNITDFLSDHYPVFTSWSEPQKVKLYD